MNIFEIITETIGTLRKLSKKESMTGIKMPPPQLYFGLKKIVENK